MNKLFNRMMILVILFSFFMLSFSSSSVLSRQSNTGVLADESLFLIEREPNQRGRLYADGSVIDFEIEKVSRFMTGSETKGMRKADLQNIIWSSGQFFDEDDNKAYVGTFEANGGLDIVFVVSNPPSGALDALESVAQYLESVFTDPITVTINVQFQQMASNILGGTSSYYAYGSWPEIRDGLINDMDGDDTIQSWLPTEETIGVRYDGSSSTVTPEDRCFVTIANCNAAIASLPGAAASMTFNSIFSWDWDPSNGVSSGTYCFQSVAVHETGHALGFTSGADFRSYDMEVLDLYRFQKSDGGLDYNPDTLAEFQSTPRLVSYNSPDNDHNSDLISVEYEMSDGNPYQASHFRQYYVNAIMQPAFSSATTFYPDFLREPDKVMFDAIGWDYSTNAVPTCSLSASPDSGEAPFTTTFSMSASDSDGTITSWELDVDNDGTSEYDGSDFPPDSQIHTYTDAAVYTAELTVWDDFGATATDTTLVTVTGPNTPPDTPISPNPVNGAIDIGVSPTLSVYVNDNEGDTMTVTFYEDGVGSIGTDTVSGSGTASYVWSAANEYSTTYSWYAVTDDGEYQTPSDTWSFTTESTPPQRFYANQDIQVQNGGISGSYASTFISNNIYEEIREAKTGPMSKLQHKWTFPVDAGYGSYIFSIEAYHTSNSEGDNFIFAYSTDDITYADMLTVTKTSDNNAYQTYALPTDLSGNVYIRVVDTDQTKGNNVQDLIFVDHMFIEVSGTPPPNRAPNAPITPDPVDEATDVSTNPTLSVFVEDPDGDAMDVTFINAVTLTDIGTAYGVPSGSRASFDWLDLTTETPYSWYAVASDTEYSTDSDVWSFTTGPDLPPGGVYVWNITWREKTAGKNTFLYYTVWIKIDSNSNGIAEETDNPASGATVYSTLTNLVGGSWDHSGLTDSNGQIEFGEKVGSGDYMAEATNIVFSGYTYNSGMDKNNPSYYTLP